MSAESAAVLNVAEDHLDWYAAPIGGDYAADKGRIYERVQRACVYNVADPETERLVREADVVEGARAIGFTLGMPGVGHARRGRRHPGRPRLHRGARHQRRRAVHRSPTWPRPRPHFVANALAAAALARAHGVSQAAVRDGLRGVPPRRPPDRRRSPSVDGVDLGRRLQGHQPARRPVLAAGLRPGRLGRRRTGQGRPLRRPRASRCATGCAASCCSAATAHVIAEALSRHAPDVPVIDVGDERRLASRWTRVVRGRGRARPTRATPCCWRPAAPRWTCSPTTPRAATPSRPPCAAAAPATGEPTDTRRSPGTAIRRGDCPAGTRPATEPARGPRRRPRSPAPATASGRAWFAAAAHALDRPLTSYYLLLGALGAAADHRPDHGAERLERLRLRATTATPTPCVQRQLMWVVDRPARARGSPPGCRIRLHPPARLAGLLVSPSCCSR